MANRLSRRQFARMALLSIFGAGSTGCGTIMHPERRGQPAGPLDWKIVALDAIGLFFFFVPGVIAFAVDFSNGTIYLPSVRYGEKSSAGQTKQLTSLRIPREKFNLAAVEKAVSTHAQREIRLVPGQYRTEALESIDEFWTAHEKLAAL